MSVHTADQMALEPITHATTSAKKLGSPIGPEKILEIIEKALRETTSDQHFINEILEAARSYL